MPRGRVGWNFVGKNVPQEPGICSNVVEVGTIVFVQIVDYAGQLWGHIGAHVGQLSSFLQLPYLFLGGL